MNDNVSLIEASPPNYSTGWGGGLAAVFRSELGMKQEIVEGYSSFEVLTQMLNCPLPVHIVIIY